MENDTPTHRNLWYLKWTYKLNPNLSVFIILLFSAISYYLFTYGEVIARVFGAGAYTLNLVLMIILLFMSLFLIISVSDRQIGFDKQEGQILGISVIILWGCSLIAAMLTVSDIVVAGATLILVIVTAYNISYTRKIGSESLEAQKEAISAQKQALVFQTKPIINVYLKENIHDIKFLDLLIENCGPGMAKNLQFTFDKPEYPTLSGDPISKLHIFQKGIQFLSPKQKYSIPIIHFPSLKTKISGDITDGTEIRKILKEKLPFTLKLNYEDHDGKSYNIDFDLDPCFVWGLRYPNKGKSDQDQQILADSSGNINLDSPKTRKKSRYEPKF